MSTFTHQTALETVLGGVVKLSPSIIVESALFGVLTLLVAFAVITIVQQGISTRPHIFMLIAITFMYVASSVHWTLNLYTFLREIRDPDAWLALPPETIFQWSVITTAALFFDFWISDIIVMWRTIVVWQWNRWITGGFFVLTVAPLVLALVDVGSAHATASEHTFNPNIYGATALGISLLSNIVATTLIGIKAWTHRRSIQKFLQSSDRPSAVQNALVLLIESGFLYCAIWALFIVSTMLNKGSFVYTAHTISGVVPQLVGLYPSVIIVLVTLRKTHCDRNFTYETAEHGTVLFAAESARPRPTVTSMAWLEEDDPRGTVIVGHQPRARSPHHSAHAGIDQCNDPNTKSPRWDKDEEDDAGSIASVVKSASEHSHV